MSSTYEYDPTRIAGSGETVEGDAGAAIANRAVVYVAADGLFYEADASVATTMPAISIAMSAMNAGDHGEFLVKGFIGLSTWTWTTGSDLYVSDAAGVMAHIAGTVSQLVGVAFSSTQIFFHPQGVATGTVGTVTVRLNTGADVGTRPRLNFIEGSATYLDITAVDDAPGSEVDLTFTSEGIGVRERPGAEQGPRRVINLIEGANVTITVADNPGNLEVDVTVAATTPTREFFVPVIDPNATLGDHPGIDLPDATDTNVYAQVYLPSDFATLDSCDIVVVSAASGNMVWVVNTDFGEICNSEDYNTHTDTGGATTGLVINDLECLDITAAFTGVAANDLVGIKFIRDGDNEDDTIGDSVYFLGIRVGYS